MPNKKGVKTAKGGESSGGIRTAASNRRAFFNYEILEKHEAGIVLTGTEIKSLRAGKVDLGDGYARVRDGELWLHNTFIAPCDPASQFNHDPRRMRKLLMHRDEIEKLASEVAEKGLTLVALRIYIKGHVAKVELGLVRGKRRYDKRQAIISRDMDREARRAVGAMRG